MAFRAARPALAKRRLQRPLLSPHVAYAKGQGNCLPAYYILFQVTRRGAQGLRPPAWTGAGLHGTARQPHTDIYTNAFRAYNAAINVIANTGDVTYPLVFDSTGTRRGEQRSFLQPRRCPG